MAMVVWLVSGCGAGSVPVEATPETTAGSSGLVGNTVGLRIDDVDYELGWDVEGCISLQVWLEGELHVPEKVCEHVDGQWYRDVNCLQREVPEPSSTTMPDAAASMSLPPCLLEVPTVFFGHLGPGPDLLCLPEKTDRQIGPASFAPVSAEGLFLIPGMQRPLFAYRSDGKAWGEPLIGQPGDWEYQLCDAAGPWEAPVPHLTGIPLVFDIEASLFDAEPLGIGFSFDGRQAALDVNTGTDSRFFFGWAQVYTDTTEVQLTAFTQAGFVATDLGTFRLPDEIIAELSSGWSCNHQPALVIGVDAGVLDHDPAALSLSWLPVPEAAALQPIMGEVADRQPGEPCPNDGMLLPPAERATADRAVLATISMTFDNSWLDLSGQAFWTVHQAGLASGAIVHQIDPINPPTITWESWVAAGAEMRIWIDSPTAELNNTHPGMVVLEIPPLPPASSPIHLELTIGPGQLVPPTLDMTTVTLRWK